MPAPQQPHEQHQRVEQYHYGKVVCNLRVVGLDLEAHGKREQRGAETAVRQPFLLVQGRLVGIYERGEHPRKEGYGLHLGIVAHLDYLHVVRAEGHGDRAAYRKQRMHAQRKHQQPRADKRDEKIGRGTPSGEQEVVYGLGPVAVRGGVYGCRGHTSEHRFRPCRPVVRMCRVPLHHLVRHALPPGNVALVDYLSREDLRDECI